ncbi:hypothetical protein E2C01_039628 [Portunus trituberculatus]|uniref:Uncharacterized protein n=1 Tax=Portunus trituberculatus TaxID=210409 RepID=A0A5B7FHC2_PORTR|nr:hypothetical protein [Portunus trituberculatus]
MPPKTSTVTQPNTNSFPRMTTHLVIVPPKLPGDCLEEGCARALLEVCQVMVEGGTLAEDSHVRVTTWPISTLRGLAQPRTSHAGTAGRIVKCKGRKDPTRSISLPRVQASEGMENIIT